MNAKHQQAFHKPSASGPLLSLQTMHAIVNAGSDVLTRTAHGLQPQEDDAAWSVISVLPYEPLTRPLLSILECPLKK